MKVSILIPCHNAERWIHDAVDSALAQTWSNIEVIVWDDGSTDGSADILRSFGNQIRCLGGQAIGSNPARNRLLATATGDWVQFLDADDYLEPDKISTQLAEAPSDADVLFSPVIEEIWRDHSVTSRKCLEIDASQDLHALWLDWKLAQTGTVLWKRSAIDQIGGWNEAQPCCQDNEIMLRALQAKLTIAYTPSAKTVYRLWSEHTLCRKDPLRVIEERTRLMDRMLEWLRLEGLEGKSHEAVMGKAALEMARTLAQHDLHKAARYLDARKRQHAIRLTGHAAPFSYRAAYRLFGFRLAEQLALMLRSANA